MHRILIVTALAVTASVAESQAAPATAQTVATTLTEFKLNLARDTVKAGPVTFKVKNSGVMTHALFVRGGKIAKGSKEIAAGEEATFTVSLVAGTYEVYCPMSDLSHKMAGMTKAFVVLASDAAPVTKKP